MKHLLLNKQDITFSDLSKGFVFCSGLIVVFLIWALLQLKPIWKMTTFVTNVETMIASVTIFWSLVGIILWFISVMHQLTSKLSLLLAEFPERIYIAFNFLPYSHKLRLLQLLLLTYVSFQSIYFTFSKLCMQALLLVKSCHTYVFCCLNVVH